MCGKSDGHFETSEADGFRRFGPNWSNPRAINVVNMVWRLAMAVPNPESLQNGIFLWRRKWLTISPLAPCLSIHDVAC
jgi:hypothetical protein